MLFKSSRVTEGAENFHYQHHEVYVNFAYGAFYNHPIEGIPIDGIGFPICLKIAQMSIRQSTLFGVIWTIKTVCDSQENSAQL